MTLPTTAKDFTALTIDNYKFSLSDYKGDKIFLSFLRNGACAMCNLRVQEIRKRYDEFKTAGIKVICVFESSIADMLPYVGTQDVPFLLLSDPEGKLYNIYEVESSEEKINAILKNGLAHQFLEKANAAGFPTIKQEGSNFFRMPAEFLIDEEFNIVLSNYTTQVADHIPLDNILLAD